MFEKAIQSLKAGWRFKDKFTLLTLAAYTSRTSSRWATKFLIDRAFFNDRIKLKLNIPNIENEYVEVLIRKEDFESDYQGICELILFNCYTMPLKFQPEIIVDGGGNTGLFTLLANRFYPECPILLFEPLESNLKIIGEHLALNKAKCISYKGIITDQDGEFPFYIREANTSSFDSSDPYTDVIYVKSFNLYDQLNTYSFNKALIKLDIEGAEVQVIPELLNKF
jgi:FkbM family methyltransferase